MKWKVWLGDGRTFASDRWLWQDVPAWNVQVLGTEDDYVGRELDQGKPFYLWFPGASKPWGVDAAGLFDFLHVIGHAEAGKPLSHVDFNALIPDGVKFGRSLDNARFRAILDQSNQDTFLPRKTGTLAHEKRDG